MLFRRWRRKRVLDRHLVADAAWHDLLRQAPVLAGLAPSAQQHLRGLATLLLHEKRILPAGGFHLDESMQLRVAAFAALPVLELGLDWYGNFHAVLVYPEEFVVPARSWTDEFGVEHVGDEVLSGEAWDQGGIILAWPDVASSGRGTHNVVIHECAHKLDMLDGSANGMPPLHRGMDPRAWTDAFTRAWEALNEQLERGQEPWLDPYAAEDPAEFFSVCSEMFFEQPHAFREQLPAVHQQLAAWFRQDPAAR